MGCRPSQIPNALNVGSTTAVTAAAATLTAAEAAARTAATATSTRTALAACSATNGRWLAGQKSFSLQFFTCKLARTANGFSLFARFLF